MLGTLIADVPPHALPDPHATHASRHGSRNTPPPRAGSAAEDKACRLHPCPHWPDAVIARRAVLAAGLLAALPARAQGASLRLAQYKAGDQLLLRLAGEDAAAYRADWFEFGSGNLMVGAVSAGSLDLAYGSEVPPAFVALSGAPMDAAALGDRPEGRLYTAIARATGARGNTTALVGTPRQVADALLDYHALGVSTFLLRGFDPLQDALHYGRTLLPLTRRLLAERTSRQAAAE